MSDATKDALRELWLDFLELKVLTQFQISLLRNDGLKELKSLQNQIESVKDRLQLLQKACKHPNKGAAHVCPDCGFDDE